MIRAFLVCLALAPLASAFADDWQERPDWAPFFTAAGVQGTMAMVDERGPAHWVYGAARAAHRYPPASTFKIAHALFALDAGVVRDEFQVFPWDGVQRDISAWNRNQDLRSSMRNSVVWVYQDFARKLGERRELRYLRQINYGNARFSGRVDDFWLNGTLTISAYEQLDFLQRLYRNQLPISVQDQRLVNDIMIVEAGRDWLLRAKTGWQSRTEPQVGWWVGWVEWPAGPGFDRLGAGRAILPSPNSNQRSHPMLQLKPLDPTMPIFQQLGSDVSPVVLVNVFQVDAPDIPALLKAWEVDANWMKQQPGYISTQLHQGIGGSTAFMNYAIWESVAHFRTAFNHPEFKAALAHYPSSAVASPHLFTRLTVPNLCVGP